MSYTALALLAVALAVVIDRWVARTRVTSTRDWWSAYAIIVFFQLLTNGWLTGRRIVQYDPERIVGNDRVVRLGEGRILYAPVEDLLFGFALVLTSVVAWVRLGQRSRDPEPHSDRRRGARGRVSTAATRFQSMQPTDIGVDGPTPFDMARAFRSVRRDPLSFLRRISEQYGDLVAFPVPGPPALLVNDPDDVRHVLQEAARNWVKRTVQYGALARVTGQGLLASAEPNWIKHRRLAAPAFHHQRLEAVSDDVRVAADHALEEGLGHLRPGASEIVDVGALTHRVGLDAVGRALFSADLSGHAQQLLDATSDAAERPPISFPSKRILPPSGLSRPAMVDTVVVLPAPLRPNMTAVSPSSTSKLMPISTGKP